MTINISLHHVHFALKDVEQFCKFYCDNFGAEKIFDDFIDGDRNVFLRIGQGRIHLFETQNAPRHERNAFHHLGMLIVDLPEFVSRLQSNGVPVSAITDVPGGRFAMVMGPENIKIELFEVTGEKYRKFFIN